MSPAMRKMSYIVLLGSALMWAGTPAPAAFQPRPGRILEWGWNTPKATYIKDHIAEMEQVPFDGLGIDLKANITNTSYSWNVWSPTALNINNYSQDVSALKGTNFSRFKSNYLLFNVAPGTVDWYDSNFSAVLTNVTNLAKVAKDAKAKGILLDVEIYNDAYKVWDYDNQTLRTTYSFAQYKQQVRTRGQQFMQAMQSVYPDVTVLMTYGYYVQFPDARYDLLPSFIDGMLDVGGASNLIFDGWEFSYGYTTDTQFANAYDIMRNQGLAWTANPAKYQTNYRSSFALWIDYGATWYPTVITLNYFTPQGFTTSLNLAASYSEGYVWIYSQMANWWVTDTNDPKYVPQAYKDALAQVVRHRETEQFAGTTKDNTTWYKFTASAQITQNNLIKLYGYSYDTINQQGQADYTTKTVAINLGDKLTIEVTPKLTGSQGRGGIILTDNSEGQTSFTLNDGSYVGLLWQSGAGGQIMACSKTSDGLTQVSLGPTQALNTKYVYQIERISFGQARLTVLDTAGISLATRTLTLNGVQSKLYIALCAQAADVEFDNIWVTRASQVPGDVNQDNLVDATDLGIINTNWGVGFGATLGQGDSSGDGSVDSADLDIMADNWGTNGNW